MVTKQTKKLRRGKKVEVDSNDLLKSSANEWLKRMEKENKIFLFFEQYGIAIITIIVAIALFLKLYYF